MNSVLLLRGEPYSIGGVLTPAICSGVKAPPSAMMCGQLSLWLREAMGLISKLLCSVLIINCSITGVTGVAGTKGLSLETYEISLRPGEKYQLKIGGLGSAGYRWEQDIEGEVGIVAVSMESLPPPIRPLPGGAAPDSYSIEQLLIITALAPGIVKVHLSLRTSVGTR